MSSTTIHQAYGDIHLRNRLTASIGKETWANEALGNTPFGLAVKASSPSIGIEYFIWPLVISTEADYQYAVETGNQDPGGDPGVISDEEIASSVQTNWPDTWPLSDASAPA